MGDPNAKLIIFLVCAVLVIGAALLVAYLLSKSPPTTFHRLTRPREVSAVTSLGAVTGLRVSVLDRDVAVFYGVPFADAPLGADRFSPPSPGTPWSGYRDASERVRDRCVQPALSSLVDNDPQGFVGAENCLHVNVFAPDGATNRSVLVILHGGEFQRGSNDDALYDGRYMAAAEDVVVFVPNYRLNVFGFLTTPFFSVPGNQGLRDQHAALEWVSKNAAAFGGNNASVTLVGVDSGALSAGLHLLMPATRRLFHRVVMQGGSPFEATERVPFAGPPEIGEYAAAVCAHGWRTASTNDSVEDDDAARSLIECLRAASPFTLLHDLEAFDGVNGKQFGPVYEPWGKGSVLVAGVPTATEEGTEKADPSRELLPALNGTQLLIGHTANEGEFYLAQFFKDWSLAQVGHWPRGFVRIFLERLVLHFFARPRLGPVWRLYFSGNGYSSADRYVQAAEFLADVKVACPSGVMADLVARRGGTVYRYVLEATASDVLPHGEANDTVRVESEQQNATSEFYRNPTHYFDALVTLGGAFGAGRRMPEKVLAQSRRLMRRWATFAKTGTPTSLDDEPWPRYDTYSKSLLRFTMDDVSTVRVEEDGHCDFMMAHSRWRELAVAA
ncbi:acetylcholinesterase-like [Dermacentor albipictus]|uniref:acetylcholinesterase-like n=1 Tax=Dermacentor albipictus TaxID=60249 RepID=UPI0031FBE738